LQAPLEDATLLATPVPTHDDDSCPHVVAIRRRRSRDDRKLYLATAGDSDPPPPDKAPGESEDVDVEDAPVSAVPRRYKVIFHNDDYTTQEFVVHVLQRFFHKTETEAQHIMLTVHHKGAAVAGVYTKDVAETKVQQVMDAARDNGMPLLLTTEPE
jgi:ATP-dependent Clp protease adaptor protein ClpS